MPTSEFMQALIGESEEVHDYLGHKIHLSEEPEYGWQWRVEFADEREDAFSNWFESKEICLAAAQDFLEKGGKYDRDWRFES